MPDPGNNPSIDSQVLEKRSDLDATSDSAQPTAKTPHYDIGSIGPYRLLTKLGEGGMGQVWLAEQASPVKRQVALKVTKFGRFNELVLRRLTSSGSRWRS